MHVDGNNFMFTKYFLESKLIKGSIFRKYTSENLEQFQVSSSTCPKYSLRTINQILKGILKP